MQPQKLDPELISSQEGPEREMIKRCKHFKSPKIILINFFNLISKPIKKQVFKSAGILSQMFKSASKAGYDSNVCPRIR